MLHTRFTLLALHNREDGLGQNIGEASAAMYLTKAEDNKLPNINIVSWSYKSESTHEANPPAHPFPFRQRCFSYLVITQVPNPIYLTETEFCLRIVKKILTAFDRKMCNVPSVKSLKR